MSIPFTVKIQNNVLPDTPGVYLMKDAAGKVLYVGKAVDLKRRVSQHFERPHGQNIEEMLPLVRQIDYVTRPTALEALILEANLIKHFWPPYNVLQKDNRSFLYLVITREDFPRPLLVRGTEMEEGSKNYRAVFGPYTSPNSLRAALDLVRRIFPWSTCLPGQKRPCFYVHLKQCPGVCVNAIDKKAYGKIIRDLIKFFEGKKDALIKQYRRDMKKASDAQRYEEAGELKRRLGALTHIQDIAIMKREESDEKRVTSNESVLKATVNLFGRIEGYDISNISGTSAVASMVVFENGAPAKSQYRKFRIKTVFGPNDVASIREVLHRRFKNAWRKPDVILVDGGLPQVHAAEAVLRELKLNLPVIGMAKGAERKRNDLVCSRENQQLCAACAPYQDVLVRVRDEAHRFAIAYHRKVRGRIV